MNKNIFVRGTFFLIIGFLIFFASILFAKELTVIVSSSGKILGAYSDVRKITNDSIILKSGDSIKLPPDAKAMNFEQYKKLEEKGEFKSSQKIPIDKEKLQNKNFVNLKNMLSRLWTEATKIKIGDEIIVFPEKITGKLIEKSPDHIILETKADKKKYINLYYTLGRVKIEKALLNSYDYGKYKKCLGEEIEKIQRDFTESTEEIKTKKRGEKKEIEIQKSKFLETRKERVKNIKWDKFLGKEVWVYLYPQPKKEEQIISLEKEFLPKISIQEIKYFYGTAWDGYYPYKHRGGKRIKFLIVENFKKISKHKRSHFGHLPPLFVVKNKFYRQQPTLRLQGWCYDNRRNEAFFKEHLIAEVEKSKQLWDSILFGKIVEVDKSERFIKIAEGYKFYRSDPCRSGGIIPMADISIIELEKGQDIKFLTKFRQEDIWKGIRKDEEWLIQYNRDKKRFEKSKIVSTHSFPLESGVKTKVRVIPKGSQPELERIMNALGKLHWVQVNNKIYDEYGKYVGTINDPIVQALINQASKEE